VKYAYFPGCSSAGTGVAFEMSAQYVAKKIGMELVEIPDWNCCGAGHMTNHDAAIAIPARNLALAETLGCDEVATPCAACYARMKTASVYCRKSEENLNHIKDIIEMPFEAKNDVISLLEAFSRDEAKEAIKAAITKPLNGAKIASYYGCLLVRPEGICDFDDNENPTSMDDLMAIAGADPVDWAFKVECCGASHQVAAPKVGRDMISKIIINAVKNGAEAIVTACPLCMLNLDMRMKEIAQKHGAEYNIPVYFFTEMLAVAMGADPKQIGTDKHFVPAVEYAEKIVKPVAAPAEKTEKNGGEA
jgi:heterodisulfide reductase subunit B